MISPSTSSGFDANGLKPDVDALDRSSLTTVAIRERRGAARVGVFFVGGTGDVRRRPHCTDRTHNSLLPQFTPAHLSFSHTRCIVRDTLLMQYGSRS